jgi:hypothetical protein
MLSQYHSKMSELEQSAEVLNSMLNQFSFSVSDKHEVQGSKEYSVSEFEG